MENELYHYGVLGQKWGVRRYQNADGSLTAEGKKRYAKELKSDNKDAFEYGSEATIYGRASVHAANKAAKLEDKAKKKLEKDPEMLKKSTQRAVEKEWAAETAALKIAKEYKQKEADAKKHCEELMKKYGNEKIKDISYKDVKLSKSAANKLGRDSIKVVNEKVNNLNDWASAGAASVLSVGASALMGLPVAVLFTPQSAGSQGRDIANYYYAIERSKKYNQYDSMPRP